MGPGMAKFGVHEAKSALKEADSINSSFTE